MTRRPYEKSLEKVGHSSIIKEFWVDHVERAHQSSCSSSGSTCTGHEGNESQAAFNPTNDSDRFVVLPAGSLFYQKVVCILQNHKAPASGVCVLQSKRQAQAGTPPDSSGPLILALWLIIVRRDKDKHCAFSANMSQLVLVWFESRGGGICSASASRSYSSAAAGTSGL